jgi:Peptidase inhibitor I9
MFTTIVLIILSSFILNQSILLIPAKSVYANAEINSGTALMHNKQPSQLTEQNSLMVLLIADTNTSITNINITNKTISDQYIITLKNDLIRTPKAVEDALGNLTAKVQSEGAKVIYVYNYSIKGIAIKIPNQQILEKLLKDLRNDTRVANIEPDKTVKAF